MENCDWTQTKMKGNFEFGPRLGYAQVIKISCMNEAQGKAENLSIYFYNMYQSIPSPVPTPLAFAYYFLKNSLTCSKECTSDCILVSMGL